MKIIECVPNFSEGRNLVVVDKIVDAFRAREGVKLLNYSADADHNRMVVTAAGEPEAMKRAVVEAIGVAVREIDLTRHDGGHPRIGAADVVPFVPISGMTMQEAVEFSREVAREVAKTYALPVYLYEESASTDVRRRLPDIRRGGFEGLGEKMRRPEWKPDFGGDVPHRSAGAVVIGARMPLVAYNINLNCNRIEVANEIARRVRHIGGGLRFCRAMGVELKSRGIAQVSMNLTDYTKTSIYRAHELVRIEAAHWGVTIAGAEVIGLVPMQALVDVAEYYLGLENFSIKQVFECAVSE